MIFEDDEEDDDSYLYEGFLEFSSLSKLEQQQFIVEYGLQSNQETDYSYPKWEKEAVRKMIEKYHTRKNVNPLLISGPKQMDFSAAQNEAKIAIADFPEWELLSKSTSERNDFQFIFPQEKWFCRKVFSDNHKVNSIEELLKRTCENHKKRFHQLLRSRDINISSINTAKNLKEISSNNHFSSIYEDWRDGDLGTKPWPWQIQAFKNWIEHARVGVVEAVTGSGKSMLGILAALEGKNDRLTTVVVVPKIILQDQWVDDLRKVGIEAFLIGGKGKSSFPSDFKLPKGSVVVAVVNSLSNNMHIVPKGSLLIADEVHNYCGEQFSKIFNSNFSRRLGLSATLVSQDSAVNVIYNYFGGSPIFSYELFEAIQEGVVVGYKVAIVLCESPQVVFSQRQLLLEELVSCHKSLQRLGLEAAEYRLTDTQIEQLKASPLFSPFAERIQEIDKRIDKLDEKSNLDSAIIAMASAINKVRYTVTFSDVNDRATAVTRIFVENGVSSVKLNSETTPSQRKSVLERVDLGEIAAIVAPRVLDEGVNIRGLRIGIFAGSSRNKLQLVQRIGRVLRVDAGKKNAKLIFLVAKGSHDDPRKLGNSNLEFSKLRFIWDGALYGKSVFDIETQSYELQNWILN